jgi:hypothetical protein
MKRVISATLLIVSLFIMVSAQDEYSQRTLLKRTIYFVYGNKQVEKADYWSIPLGNFDFEVMREYPGEGNVAVTGSANLSFISSGYIEGAGYGERGKINVNADFCYEDGDSLKNIELKDIDYIYYGGTKIKLKNGETKELYITIEDPKNKVQAKGTSIMVFKYNKDWGELKHSKDVDRVIGFSFTKDGALRAYSAALKANE